MSGSPLLSSVFIGWDVGGWNCDRNRKSRDAIVIIDADRKLIGQPWRGNLRKDINEATSANDWIRRLFEMCAANPPKDIPRVTLAIDTPLGFSEAFVGLVTGRKSVELVGSSDTNPYLFRYTERYLFKHGLKPLSAVKDRIGSQATKGMHVLAKFAPKILSCGVWTDSESLTAIEVYPSACRKSATIDNFRREYLPFVHADKDDALTCAFLAYLFAERLEELAAPAQTVPAGEGWIWIPRDGFQ